MRPDRLIATFLASVSLCAAGSATAATFRVDASSGAPRITRDGQPIRARMFWGAPGRGTLALKQGPNEVSFVFTPTDDEPERATLHFRFGQDPGQIDLDDVRIEDLDDGRDVFRCDFEGGPADLARQWRSWPPGKQNTVAALEVADDAGQRGSRALRVRLAAPPGGRWPDFHIYSHGLLALNKAHRYRVTFWARSDRARRIAVTVYRPGQPFVVLGGPDDCFASQIRLAADAGVDLVSFPVPMPWPEPGKEVDWHAADAACQNVLAANPHALLLPRIGCAAPRWWREAHPDHMMAWDREAEERDRPTVASPLYRADVSARLAALVEHLEAKFGDRMAGYHPCGQNTGEWFYEGTWKMPLNGHAPADRAAWREWLAERYGTDAALRAAWQNAQVTLAGADVPAPEARRASPAGALRDPIAERAVVDWARFQQESMAGCVCQLAHAVRSASKGRKLVVFFYGYVFEFGPVRNGPATSGHYALRRVLDCPDIDVVCSPISYFDRALAESAPAMTAAESVALAGKMWLYEDDTSTYLSTGTPPGHKERVADLDQSNQLLLRNTAQCALRNFGSWWMDLGAAGWFNDARMWSEMTRLAALDNPLLARARPFRPEIAAAIDPQSMLLVAPAGTAVTIPGVYEVRRALGRCGAPYGQYLQDDVAQGRVDAKLCVMLTSWQLSADQRRALLTALRGRTRVWCYAPGWLDGDRTSLDAMRELTGFAMKPVRLEKSLAQPTAEGRKLGLTEPLGTERRVEPLFAAADATPEETLAVYADGSAAVALRRSADGDSLFVGPPGLAPQLVRLAARRAGVHLFSQVDANVWANGPYLSVHAAQDGPLTLDTGRAAPIVDLLSGKALGRGPQITLPIQKAQTRVLEIGEPGK